MSDEKGEARTDPVVQGGGDDVGSVEVYDVRMSVHQREPSYLQWW